MAGAGRNADIVGPYERNSSDCLPSQDALAFVEVEVSVLGHKVAYQIQKPVTVDIFSSGSAKGQAVLDAQSTERQRRRVHTCKGIK